MKDPRRRVGLGAGRMTRCPRVLQPRPCAHTGYEALAEAPCPTVLPPQPPEDVVSSGPEDCSFFPNGAFDHCLSHIPSIYTDT